MSRYITPEMIGSELNSGGFGMPQQVQGGDKMLQNLDKVEKLLDKGMALFDRFQQIKQKKAEQESMASQIETKANKMAIQQAQPQVVYRMPRITFKTELAVEELYRGVEWVNQKYGDRTVKSLVEDEVKKLAEGGLVKPFIEGILKNIVEVHEE